jgi:hypothetical protein
MAREWNPFPARSVFGHHAGRIHDIESPDALTPPTEFPQDVFRSEFDNHDGGISSDRSMTIRHGTTTFAGWALAMARRAERTQARRVGRSRGRLPKRTHERRRTKTERLPKRTHERRRTNPISAGSQSRHAGTNGESLRELGRELGAAKAVPKRTHGPASRTKPRPGGTREAV